MAKKFPEWFEVLITALTASPGAPVPKHALRSAARGKALEPVRGRFILWVLREFIPSCSETEAVAALWDRRMAGDEPTEAEWHEAAEAARLAALAENAGDKGMDRHRMARSPRLATPEGQRGLLMMEPTLCPGALKVFKIVHGVAITAAHSMDTCDAAWSAALVARPDAMRGVVTSAARTSPAVDFAYGVMGEKLLSLLSAA